MGKFSFKQFDIINTESAMKVGTDSVLLGSWMRCMAEDRMLLDIGCGTGILSLMAAQRTPHAMITGIEIDGISAKEAKENALRSPWPGRIEILNCSVQEYASSGEVPVFDHIFSNPPYFSSSLKSPEKRKSEARHNDSLPFETLIDTAMRLMSDDGRLSIILPAYESRIFTEKAHLKGLYLARACHVKTTSAKPPKRILSEFSKKAVPAPFPETLTIQDNGSYTAQYRKLTEDFHPFF